MSAVSKDEEIRQVSAELKRRLRELRETVAELNAILLPPEADASKEQVVAP